MVEESFYTVGELARLLKVSKRTVQRWLKSGKIAHYVLLDGRNRRIPGSVVDKLLAECLKPRKTKLKLR